MLGGANLIRSLKRVTEKYITRKGCGLVMMLEKYEEVNCQEPMCGHSDSHAKMLVLPESSEASNEAQEVDCFLKSCGSLMRKKTINPSGLSLKMLRIYSLLTEDTDSIQFCEMAERGYTCEWKVYNTKDYGLPQNRERVYLVGYLGETGGRELLPIPRKNDAVIKQVIGGSQGMRVYDPSGVSCTLSALGGGMGAKTGLYQFSDVSVQACLTPDRLDKRQNGRRLKEVGEPAFTLTGQDRHGLLIKTANKQGYAMAYHGDGVDLAYPNSETRRGRVQPQRANTLTTSDNLGVVLDDGSKVYIRKLTPRECWRLQGFTDEQFDKAAAVNSNSQLYKQAGNAVSVNVVAEIGKHIMAVERETI